MMIEKDLRILVVDDDHNMTMTFLDIVKTEGYEAEEAHSASEALNRIEDDSFDCVITDVKMSGTNGVDLFRAIKRLRPELPVVLMTAYAADSLVRAGLQEGALAVLNKPLDMKRMLGFLSSLQHDGAAVIIDDDLFFSEGLENALCHQGFAVTRTDDSQVMFEVLSSERQIILLDMKLNTITALNVLRDIRKQYRHLPVVWVTESREEMPPIVNATLRIGECICLEKPTDTQEIITVLTDLRHRNLKNILVHSD